MPSMATATVPLPDERIETAPGTYIEGWLNCTAGSADLALAEDGHEDRVLFLDVQDVQSFRFVKRSPVVRLKLRKVAELSRTLISDEITRNGRGRVLSLSATIDRGVTKGLALREAFLRNILPPILQAHPGLTYGFFGETQAQQEASSGLPLSILSVNGVIALSREQRPAAGVDL